MSSILVPGRNCGATFTSDDAGVLVDGCDYYRAVYQAACHARRFILIAAWQLDTDVRLLHDEDAEGVPYPVEFLPFLEALCDERPELEIYILAWDHSMLLALERQPLQERRFKHARGGRIHVNYDDFHPIGGSHHQKMIVVDRAIAFVGGMDVCTSRWDAHEHAACDDRRTARFGMKYSPYHDVQAYVTGDAVDCLIEYFEHRWTCATEGGTLTLPEVPRTQVTIDPTLQVLTPTIAVTRTMPRMRDKQPEAIEELRALHIDAIRAARHSIYIENQYFSSDDVYGALVARMRLSKDPLEIVIVLPERALALKERISLGLRQAALLEALYEEAAKTGHHFGAYYSAACDDKKGEEVPVYIHSKVLAVDDRFLLVSSANTTNRSMGLDSELGIAWEAPRPRRAIRDVRLELLQEHTGLSKSATRRRLARQEGLVARLDALVESGKSRLRFHPMDERETLMGRLLPDDTAIDPDGPVLDDALWEATDGGGDRSLFERLKRAWATVRDGTPLAEESSHDAGHGRRDDEAAVPRAPRRG